LQLIHIILPAILVRINSAMSDDIDIHPLVTIGLFQTLATAITGLRNSLYAF